MQHALSDLKKPFCAFVVEAIRHMQTPKMLEGLKKAWATSGLTWMDTTEAARAELQTVYEAACADDAQGILFRNHGKNRQFGAVRGARGGHGRVNERDEEEAQIAVDDLLYDADEELAKAGDGDLSKKGREKVAKAIEEAKKLLKDMAKKPAAKAKASAGPRAERPTKKAKACPKPKAGA